MNFAVLIATVSVIAMLGALATPSIVRLTAKNKEYSTLLKMREVASGVEEWYRENAFTLDSASDGTTLAFGGESFYLPKADDTLEKHYDAFTSNLIRIPSLASGTGYCLGGNFPYLDAEKEGVYDDAWGDCFVLYVTEQKTAPDGIKYRDFYVVSGGEDRKVDFDGSEPRDDLVKVVSGYEVEKKLYDQTVRKLEMIRDSLESYFYSLYTLDPTRDTSVDYFLREKTDGTLITDKTLLSNTCKITGEDPDSGDCLVPLSQVAYDEDGDGSPDTDKLLDALGLTETDLKDAWGNEILVDTASYHARSPETDKDSPYTMRVVAKTPWGSEIELFARQRF